MVIVAWVWFVIQVVLGIATTYLVFVSMSEKSELGGAFGGGSRYAHFGLKKKFDKRSTRTLWVSILFVLSTIFGTILFR